MATAAAAVVVLICALAPAGARANNLFTLDSKPYTYGPVVSDNAGNAYFAWEQAPPSGTESSTTLFCKVPRGGRCTAPIALALPGGSKEGADAPVAAYPVLGTITGTVYVVAPRYVREDTVIWTSTNGGASFSGPTSAPSFAHGSGVGDVLRNPLAPANTGNPTADGIDVSSFNTQVGFSETGNFGTPFKIRFEMDPNGQGSTLGFTAAGLPVQAYWNFASPYEVAVNHVVAGSPSEEKNWSKPEVVSSGYEPRLASGPRGLFLLSTDEAGGGQPTLLDVRRYNESTNTFGAPTRVAAIPPTVASLFTGGGLYENPETGTLYVAQPMQGSLGGVMRLWESTDGGASFHGERTIAAIAGGYEGPPRLTAAPDGGGWLTFKDEHGLQVADLTSGSALLTATANVGGTTLTGSTRNQCIKNGAVPGSLSFKYPSHKRKGTVVVKVFKVIFTVGSNHLTLSRKRLSNKPFVGTLHIKHLVPGKKYVLNIHAFLAVEHGTPRQRFLNIPITACA
jgi:hypothetical protein